MHAGAAHERVGESATEAKHNVDQHRVGDTNEPTVLVAQLASPLLLSNRRTSSESDLLRLPESCSGASKLKALPHRNDIVDVPHDVGVAGNFGRRVMVGLNDAATSILLSIGYQVGLFSLMSRMSDNFYTAAEIANAGSDLSVRYVTEWLAGMSCAGIVEESRRLSDSVYRLPEEHAVLLTWNSASNLAFLSQTIPILGRLEDDIAECFRGGMGLAESRFGHYDAVAAFDITQTVGESIDEMMGLVDGLAEELQSGICVFCVGGLADAVYVHMAQMFPRSWFTCYGTSAKQMASGEALVEEEGATNVRFRQLSSLKDVEEQGSYDAALILDASVVRCDEHPTEILKCVRRSLRAGRSLMLLEMSISGRLETDVRLQVAPFLYALSAMRWLTGAGGSEVAGGVWGACAAKESLTDAGFERVEVRPLGNDTLNCVLVAQSSHGNAES